jgi:hypothetical protein
MPLNLIQTYIQPEHQNNSKPLSLLTNDQNRSLFSSINLIIHKYHRCNPSISIESGSIFNSKCDIIVNSIGRDLFLKPTCDGKLTNQIIEKAGNSVKNAIQQSPFLTLKPDKTFSLIITESGKLKEENNIHLIYHANLDNFSYVNDVSEISFKNTIRNILKTSLAKWFDEIFKTFFLAYTNHSLQHIKIVLYENDKTTNDAFNSFFTQKDIPRSIGKHIFLKEIKLELKSFYFQKLESLIIIMYTD